MHWGRMMQSYRCSSDQNPFIHRPLVVTFISLQVCSSACCLPFLTYFHTHSRGYILTPPSHPCSTPDPPSTSSVLIISHYYHTLSLALLSHLPKGWSLHFALSHLFSQIRSFSSVSQVLYASSFNPCLHTQLLYVHVFSFQLVITNYFHFAGTHSEFLPPFNSMTDYDSFTDASKPYSCWLLLPSTKTTLPTISSCSHLIRLFSVPCFILLMPLEGPMNSLTSLPYPPAVLTASYLGGHSVSNSRSHTRKLNFLLITSDSSLQSFICLHFSFSLQRNAPVFHDKR